MADFTDIAAALQVPRIEKSLTAYKPSSREKIAQMLMGDQTPQRNSGSGLMGAPDGIGLFGFKVRDALYPGEDSYFNNNPNVTGMATELDDVILNPYSQGVNRDAVARNEAFRLLLRRNNVAPGFDLTDDQRKAFAGTSYANNDDALKATISARIYSGDPSAKATPAQQKWVDEFVANQNGTQRQ